MYIKDVLPSHSINSITLQSSNVLISSLGKKQVVSQCPLTDIFAFIYSDCKWFIFHSHSSHFNMKQWRDSIIKGPKKDWQKGWVVPLKAHFSYKLHILLDSQILKKSLSKIMYLYTCASLAPSAIDSV